MGGLGGLGGLGAGLGGTCRVLGPSWARLGLVLGGPGECLGHVRLCWGSFSGLVFGVGSEGVLGPISAPICGPKSAPKRPQEGFHNELRSVIRELLMLDKPPTFFWAVFAFNLA